MDKMILKAIQIAHLKRYSLFTQEMNWFLMLMLYSSYTTIVWCKSHGGLWHNKGEKLRKILQILVLSEINLVGFVLNCLFNPSKTSLFLCVYFVVSIKTKLKFYCEVSGFQKNKLNWNHYGIERLRVILNDTYVVPLFFSFYQWAENTVSFIYWTFTLSTKWNET